MYDTAPFLMQCPVIIMNTSSQLSQFDSCAIFLAYLQVRYLSTYQRNS
jgi:hypothetical protein